MRPLRLKSEVFKAQPPDTAFSGSIAKVWVDNGVYHLDQAFDYLVPERFDSEVQIGVRVEVPFNGRLCEGLVLARVAAHESGLKSISKVISPLLVANPVTVELIDRVRKEWAAHPFDIIRSAIPARVASVEKEFSVVQTSARELRGPTLEYLQLPPRLAPIAVIKKVVEKKRADGKTLVIVPESRLAQRIHQQFPDSILLDYSLQRSDRYRNFLSTTQQGSKIVVGTRSSIFAPIVDLAHIYIYDEGSEHYYEQRSPGWNVRDVALLRAQIERIPITFLGYSPSSEIARLIDTRVIKYRPHRERIDLRNFQQVSSELLPGRIFSEIRSGIKLGSVLFLVPRKGFAQAISCSRCRNLALCECGGRISKGSIKEPLKCVLCGSEHLEWRCTWCQGTTPFLIGRGSQRFAQEIGAAFPGIPIKNSEGDNIIENLDSYEGIVIATPGAIPEIAGGYSRVVILEGDSVFAQSDIRAQERARHIFFSAAAYLAKEGTMVTVLNQSHPILGALASWKPSIVSQQELREREAVNLPPFSRALTLEAMRDEIQGIFRGLEVAQSQGRLPKMTRILGPLKITSEKFRLVLICPLEDSEEMVLLIHEFTRRRSAAKKDIAALRIDPYSLTR